MRRILFVSTPISPIGMGDGGGVETTLLQLTPALAQRGHTVAIVAPAGSVEPRGVKVYQIPGEPPANATVAARNARITTNDYGVLEAMWDCAREIQDGFDIIVGMTYDWLSFFLTPYFRIPVIQWVSVSSMIDAVDKMLHQRFAQRPELFAFYSLSQAKTFHLPDANIIYGAVDTGCFPFRPDPAERLSWAARISPEKGLEDAVEAASRAGLPLDVCGKVQDEQYWQRIRARYSKADITWHGMLPHSRLSEVLGNSIAALATPKWTEAFGLSVVEALACGTPVIAYARGGPVEIVEDGVSGCLVAPDDIDGLIEAIRNVRKLKRTNARARAEEFSLSTQLSRFEAWIYRLSLYSSYQAI